MWDKLGHHAMYTKHCHERGREANMHLTQHEDKPTKLFPNLLECVPNVGRPFSPQRGVQSTSSVLEKVYVPQEFPTSTTSPPFARKLHATTNSDFLGMPSPNCKNLVWPMLGTVQQERKRRSVVTYFIPAKDK